jgi:hypothetical protein
MVTAGVGERDGRADGGDEHGDDHRDADGVTHFSTFRSFTENAAELEEPRSPLRYLTVKTS